jgi:hypothetical protein
MVIASGTVAGEIEAQGARARPVRGMNRVLGRHADGRVVIEVNPVRGGVPPVVWKQDVVDLQREGEDPPAAHGQACVAVLQRTRPRRRLEPVGRTRQRVGGQPADAELTLQRVEFFPCRGAQRLVQQRAGGKDQRLKTRMATAPKRLTREGPHAARPLRRARQRFPTPAAKPEMTAQHLSSPAVATSSHAASHARADEIASPCVNANRCNRGAQRRIDAFMTERKIVLVPHWSHDPQRPSCRAEGHDQSPRTSTPRAGKPSQR